MGKATFGCLGEKVSTFLDYTDAGSGFVFGYLVDQVGLEKYLDFHRYPETHP